MSNTSDSTLSVLEASRSLKVLHVEDNPQDARAVRALLDGAKNLQFSVVHVETVSAALRHLGRNKSDLILLDLVLPDGSGLDNLRAIQELAPDTPIVLLTNLDDEPTAIQALKRGAQDYVLKSSRNAAEFARTTRYAIERHRHMKEIERVSFELRAANTTLEKLVLLDPLTELLNRRGLQQILSRELQVVRRDGSELLVLMLDLDDFKQVNDSLGYAVGDIVLKEVAQQLKRSLRLTDIVARIGGDEFVVLLPQTRRAEGLRVAEKIRLSLSESPIFVPERPLQITASVGVLAVTEATPSIDELLSQTHLVLSRSKRAGKNRISCAWAGGHEGEEVHPLSHILQQLRVGDQLYSVMQPIFSLEAEEEVGYELFSRLSPGSFEMPDDFFRLCMEENILTLVDHRCYKNCIKASRSLPRGIRRHLNLFPSTILDIPPQHLIDALPEDDTRKDYCIEISEKQIIGDPSYLTSTVEVFKRAGLLIAIDDVGYGRSCLESAVLLEPDVVKIDKTFVTGVSGDPTRLRSLKRLLKVASSLGADVVAEGIERRSDLEALKDLGVKSGQGYFWGMPA
jgi:diguanylate cyclase (GGDEF)-like protein